MKLWPVLVVVVVLELVVFVLWMYSGAIDCYPHCTTYQDGVRWGAWFVLPAAILVLGIYGVVRWLTRRFSASGRGSSRT
jgi:hypothetical protein